jgi:hypothetical protein
MHSLTSSSAALALWWLGRALCPSWWLHDAGCLGDGVIRGCPRSPDNGLGPQLAAWLKVILSILPYECEQNHAEDPLEVLFPNLQQR